MIATAFGEVTAALRWRVVRHRADERFEFVRDSRPGVVKAAGGARCPSSGAAALVL